MELMVIKSMLSHYMEFIFRNFQFPPDDVNIIRRTYADPEAVKLYVKAPDGEPKPDLFLAVSTVKAIQHVRRARGVHSL